MRINFILFTFGKQLKTKINKMKKIFTLIAITALFAACSTSTPEGTATTKDTNAVKPASVTTNLVTKADTTITPTTGAVAPTGKK